MATTQNPNLTEEQKKVLFEKATEAPFTGELLHNKKSGAYTCANCNHTLFMSTAKFDSGSGWPSFYDQASKDSVVFQQDTSHGMERTEISCGSCGAHLGHIFADALDQPTGKRYCVNSLAICFKDSVQGK